MFQPRDLLVLLRLNKTSTFDRHSLHDSYVCPCTSGLRVRYNITAFIRRTEINQRHHSLTNCTYIYAVQSICPYSTVSTMGTICVCTATGPYGCVHVQWDQLVPKKVAYLTVPFQILGNMPCTSLPQVCIVQYILTVLTTYVYTQGSPGHSVYLHLYSQL